MVPKGLEELDPGFCAADHGKSWVVDAPRLSTTGFVKSAAEGSWPVIIEDRLLSD